MSPDINRLVFKSSESQSCDPEQTLNLRCEVTSEDPVQAGLLRLRDRADLSRHQSSQPTDF